MKVRFVSVIPYAMQIKISNSRYQNIGFVAGFDSGSSDSSKGQHKMENTCCLAPSPPVMPHSGRLPLILLQLMHVFADPIEIHSLMPSSMGV